MWSVKFEVWSAKSAVCSVRCGVSREGHGRDRVSLNYRSFIFGKLPPPACPGLCYCSMNKTIGPRNFNTTTVIILLFFYTTIVILFNEQNNWARKF